MDYFAIMGHGVVGSGVSELFYKQRTQIEARIGRPMELKYILDRRELEGELSSKLTHRFEDILEDQQVGYVVECMGGIDPAYDYTRRLLEAGKSVITSNKELVAQKGTELLAIARKRHVNYLFEASVGGGIPVIHPLYQCIGFNQIDEIAGILNGTSNYILTRMFRDGMSLDTALKMAQDLGYAEQDPSADIDGADARRKISILGGVAFGRHIDAEAVHTEGIRAITSADVALAEAGGYAIKLIGRVKRQGDRVLAAVSPALIKKESPLANVDDVYNAILVRGADIGDVMFYGRGAGKLPTGSAIIADLIDAARATDTLTTHHWQASPPDYLIPASEEKIQLFVRVNGGGPRAVENVFGHVEFIHGGKNGEELAFITGPDTDARLQAVVALSNTMKIQVQSAIRLLPY